MPVLRFSKLLARSAHASAPAPQGSSPEGPEAVAWGLYEVLCCDCFFQSSRFRNRTNKMDLGCRLGFPLLPIKKGHPRSHPIGPRPTARMRVLQIRRPPKVQNGGGPFGSPFKAAKTAPLTKDSRIAALCRQ